MLRNTLKFVIRSKYTKAPAPPIGVKKLRVDEQEMTAEEQEQSIKLLHKIERLHPDFPGKIAFLMYIPGIL